MPIKKAILSSKLYTKLVNSKIYNKMFEINTKDSVYNITDSTYNLIEIDSNLIDEDDAAQQSWKEYTPVSDTNK